MSTTTDQSSGIDHIIEAVNARLDEIVFERAELQDEERKLRSVRAALGWGPVAHLSEGLEEMLALVRTAGGAGITTPAAARALRVPAWQTRRHAERLQQEGLVRIVRSPTGRLTVFASN